MVKLQNSFITNMTRALTQSNRSVATIVFEILREGGDIIKVPPVSIITVDLCGVWSSTSHQGCATEIGRL